MKTQELLQEVKVSVLATLALLIILCGVYPVVVWGIAQVAFPSQANGSLVEVQGKVVGSRLMAQAFSGAQYFHPRPSAAGDTAMTAPAPAAATWGLCPRSSRIRSRSALPVIALKITFQPGPLFPRMP